MPISRMQQPRQLYGLGSIVKKAVKGVTGAVKGAAKGIKSLAKSDAGKLALLAGSLYGAKQFGLFDKFPGLPSLPTEGYFSTKGGKTLLAAGAGTLLGGLGAAVEEGDPEAIAATRDVGALRNYLFSGYKNLGYTDDQAQELTNKDVIISPVDDRYSYPPYRNEPCQIAFSNGRHWRTDTHTTGTFMISRENLVRYWTEFIKFSRYDGSTFTENNTINHIYKKVPLFTPIPTLAIHVQDEGSIPHTVEISEWWPEESKI